MVDQGPCHRDPEGFISRLHQAPFQSQSQQHAIGCQVVAQVGFAACQCPELSARPGAEDRLQGSLTCQRAADIPQPQDCRREADQLWPGQGDPQQLQASAAVGRCVKSPSERQPHSHHGVQKSSRVHREQALPPVASALLVYTLEGLATSSILLRLLAATSARCKPLPHLRELAALPLWCSDGRPVGSSLCRVILQCASSAREGR